MCFQLSRFVVFKYQVQNTPGLGPGGGEAVCVSIPFRTSGNLGVGAEFASARSLPARPGPVAFVFCSRASLSAVWCTHCSRCETSWSASPEKPAWVSESSCPRRGPGSRGLPFRFGSLRCQSCCPVTQATVTRPEASSPFLSPFRVRWPTLDALSHVLTSSIKLYKQKVFLAKYNNSHSSLQVFQQPKTQEEVCQLSVNIMQVLCKSTDALKPEIMQIISLPYYS